METRGKTNRRGSTTVVDLHSASSVQAKCWFPFVLFGLNFGPKPQVNVWNLVLPSRLYPSLTTGGSLNTTFIATLISIFIEITNPLKMCFWLEMYLFKNTFPGCLYKLCANKIFKRKQIQCKPLFQDNTPASGRCAPPPSHLLCIRVNQSPAMCFCSSPGICMKMLILK